MVRRGTLGSFLVFACIAEVVVFIIVVHWIGFGAAVLLTFASTFLGVARLRRTGRDALAVMRGMPAEAMLREGAFVDGVLHAIGGLLLILPGFLTDFVGLVLVAPSGRRWIGRWFGIVADDRPRQRPTGTPTIELDAEDWTRIDNVRHG